MGTLKNMYILIHKLHNRYGKTKDSFGWPDESEEALNAASSTVVPTSGGAANSDEQPCLAPTPITKLERYTVFFVLSIHGWSDKFETSHTEYTIFF